VKEWAPKWGEVGHLLGRLEISKKFLDASCPARYTAAGLANVGALVDGKGFMMDTPRLCSAVKRACFSGKVKHSGARCITWTLPCGLTFEHTPLFCARATESRLVEL
jgi:hypothetical protein